ncbi:MAG: Fe-S-binding domain-containing protein, partial [Acidobacteriaceae bacterium]|nr:Fe-S-binding domain-containing protein [Acidobacteriaceae bacterium]
MNTLLITLFLPLIGFFFLLFTPRDSKAPFGVALLTTLVTFLFSLGLIGPAITNGAVFGSAFDALWVDSPPLQIHFHLGVDGVNVWLVLLTTLLVPI